MSEREEILLVVYRRGPSFLVSAGPLKQATRRERGRGAFCRFRGETRRPLIGSNGRSRVPPKFLAPAEQVCGCG